MAPRITSEDISYNKWLSSKIQVLACPMQSVSMAIPAQAGNVAGLLPVYFPPSFLSLEAVRAHFARAGNIIRPPMKAYG